MDEGHLQQLVPKGNRPEYNMHVEFAGVFSKFFKFEELELYSKRRILHFKCAGNLLIRIKLMYGAIGSEHHIALGIAMWQPDVWNAVKFQ